MTTDPKGRELFIVDNSVSGWTGLRYLDEWSSIAKAFDSSSTVSLEVQMPIGRKIMRL